MMDIVIESVLLSFIVGGILGGLLAFHFGSTYADRK